jgi:hypothetical protein
MLPKISKETYDTIFKDVKSDPDFLTFVTGRTKKPEKKYELQTGLCKKAKMKLSLLELIVDPSKHYIAPLSNRLNQYIEQIDKGIVTEIKKHKVLLEIVTSPQDSMIIIESNHPALKFARKWLGINSPMDREYSLFLADLMEAKKKGEYSTQNYSDEDKIRSDKVRRLWSEVQEKAIRSKTA